jgi:hypothetical protein
MRIGAPARRHHVADADIWHALRNATRMVTMDDTLTMLLGPATDGSMLEVGVLDIDGDDPVVIHAMPLRHKFYRFLG